MSQKQLHQSIYQSYMNLLPILIKRSQYQTVQCVCLRKKSTTLSLFPAGSMHSPFQHSCFLHLKILVSFLKAFLVQRLSKNHLTKYLSTKEKLVSTSTHHDDLEKRRGFDTVRDKGVNGIIPETVLPQNQK